jgi:hypothetical protein
MGWHYGTGLLEGDREPRSLTIEILNVKKLKRGLKSEVGRRFSMEQA